MLFGTGGGATVPTSTAGEVTPLELRRLEFGAAVWISNRLKLTVEYAGAAPGLAAGVTQINIRLPDEIPQIEGYPPGLVPLAVETPGISYYPRIVTIAVEP